MTPEKRALVRALEAELAREMEVLAKAARDAREAATHEESKPENDKDTRGLEAAYLAGAQAQRVRDLEKVSNALKFMELRAFAAGDGVGLSALIDVHGGDGVGAWYFLAPLGGGMRVTLEGVSVQVITPHSPLGQALIGKHVGDAFEVRTRQGPREYEIRALV